MILPLWLICGVVAAIIAVNKRRSGCGFLILGFILGPFGILMALLARDDTYRV